QLAAQERKVRDSMSVEDEFIAEMQGYEDRLLEAIAQREEAQREREEARVGKERAIRLLIDLGVPREEIASQLGLSAEELGNY
ncbi:MAG: hypothetical protein ACKOAY_07565, partial [Haliscomenobacter sp.]